MKRNEMLFFVDSLSDHEKNQVLGMLLFWDFESTIRDAEEED
jgi:hypothetical protein